MAIPGCPHPASPSSSWGEGLSEVQGEATGGELWALVDPGLPIHAEREVKIIWRITGSGPLELLAVHEDGDRLEPREVQAHEFGSSWNRPGEEWGSVFIFPKAGCWDVHAGRGVVAGDVWFVVR